MQEYPIEQQLFKQNPCARPQGTFTPQGIMVHSVGSKGTDVERWMKWDAPGVEKCVHAFIDPETVRQVLPWNYIAWHCGGSANKTHISFEICEPATDIPANRDALYARVLYLCVYLCRKYNLPANSVITHCEGHALGVASNHADVNHWWGRGVWKDYTMDRLRGDIARELGEESTAVALPQPQVARGSLGAAVSTLQQGLQTLGYDIGPYGADGIFGADTEKAVRAFQQAQGLAVDGIAGKNTWGALQKALQAQRESLPTLYTVREGDTLWGIAREKLGAGSRYGEILRLNGLARDVLHPGQVLKLPGK